VVTRTYAFFFLDPITDGWSNIENRDAVYVQKHGRTGKMGKAILHVTSRTILFPEYWITYKSYKSKAHEIKIHTEYVIKENYRSQHHVCLKKPEALKHIKRWK
jgi:hypothetical protein